MTDKEQLDQLVEKYNTLKSEIGKVIVGQHEAVDSLLLSVFTGGHCLLLGVPGLAKTLMVNTLSKALGLTFSRIQFTPDLMPSDITGSEILDESRQFRFIKGPVFAGIVLADEIMAVQHSIRRMPVADNVVEYAVRLVGATRPAVGGNKYISWGAGPRASQYLIMGAKSFAAMHGKYSPDIEDVRAVAHNVLRHRIVRNYYAEAEGISTDQIIDSLLASGDKML